jgi:hypothetical protein
VKDPVDTADEGTCDILLSLPRPLMPLLEFLYRRAKYSQSSLSAWLTGSPSWIVANFVVRWRIVCEWNLF